MIKLYKTTEAHTNGQEVYRKVGDKPKSSRFLLGEYFVGDEENMYVCGDGYTDEYGSWDGEPLHELQEYIIVPPTEGTLPHPVRLEEQYSNKLAENKE